MRYLTKMIFSSNDRELDSDLIQPVQSQDSAASLYCGPDGTCNLSNLDDGISGFVLQGQAAGDNSGYSVSSAGDINGDGLADILVGAYGAAYPSGSSGAGKTYVVFGTNQTNAWGSGIVNLTSLLNGQRGFVLQGQAYGGENNGYSVSSAGDINGDALADILVGAPKADLPGLADAGKTYVVFGSNQTNAWGAGTVNLTSLINGQRGFVLQGEGGGDNSGWSVSSAGDIDGDNLADILVGAPKADPSGVNSAGKTYVVFGSNQSNAWGSGTVNLTTLINGQRGFVLQGQAYGDQSGWSVSDAGDINGDGLGDMLVGAPAPNYAAKTYVVFGSNQTNAWGSGTVNLTSLIDGLRGFMLQGQAGDQSGYSVSGAGDINGDGLADILVGAPYADLPGLDNVGKTYAVFGSNQADAWGSGTVNLTSLLNGRRGFVLQGQAANDFSGVSVSDAGDINGDGLADILVGASEALNDTGKTYAVFGSNQTDAWGSGTVNLTSLLNGRRGFVLQGQAANDDSGWSVSSVGDLNGDDLADILVGAPDALNNAGKTYVVFGDTTVLTLINNSLTIYTSQTIQLTSAFLAAISQNTDNSTLAFIPTAVSHGQFELTSNPGIPLANFTQGQIWEGDIQFVQDGSTQSPSYNMSVSSGLISTNPQSANITFMEFGIVNNELTINQGQTVFLTINNLNAYVAGADDASLLFTISNLQHGQFALSSVPDQAVLSFNQQNIVDNQVSFTHDNSLIAPAYTVVMTDGQLTTSPANATIYFDTLPVIVNNQLFLSQGQTLLLNSTNILAVHDNDPDLNLQFNLTNIQYGHFERRNQSGTAITTFWQQEIALQQIVFISDGGSLAPNYQLQVTDGIADSVVSPGTTFLVTQNYLPVNQGEILPLSASYLNINSNRFSANKIEWQVNVVRYGQFVWKNNSNDAIARFTQQQIDDLAIVFVPDNSTNAPSCSLVVTDDQNHFYGMLTANIDFDTPPKLTNNQLTTSRGELVDLSAKYLLAEDNETNSDDLLFFVSNVTHGNFAYINNQKQPITQFLQKSISGNQIVFITDSSGLAPAYQMTVSDGRMNCSGCPQAAEITFDPKGPNNSDGLWSNTVIAAVAAGSIGLLFTLVGLYIKYKLVPNYFEKTQTQGTERERTYRQNVILPIARQIYNRVKFSGFMGYMSEASVRDYVDAVSEIVRQLETLSVNLNLESMRPPARSRLLESIAIHTQKQLVGGRSCCSLKNLKGVITADTTSALLRASAATIAQAVRDDMQSLEISEGEEDEKGSDLQVSRSFLNSLLSGSGQNIFTIKRPNNQTGVPLLRSQPDNSLN